MVPFPFLPAGGYWAQRHPQAPAAQAARPEDPKRALHLYGACGSQRLRLVFSLKESPVSDPRSHLFPQPLFL